MQTVDDSFHLAAQAGIRPHDWKFRASFTKVFDDNIEFAMWDTSEWDGGDLWRANDDNPIAYWDFYDYVDYSDRIVDMEWSREIDFPYSVSAAMADVTLNNYDGYFTPGKGSPIDGYLIPKRPIRLYAGFVGQSILQQFVGVTQDSPTLDNQSREAQLHALDFLSEMFSLPLTETVAMADVTTDVVLAALFEQFGLTSAQYSLAKGRNKIPFLFFNKGDNAGNAFRGLMQAEGGNLWIDELGVIRFEQRLLPVDDPVITFNDSNVVSITDSGTSQIINSVRIHSDIRQVQVSQPIYDSSDAQGNSQLLETVVVPAGGTTFFTIDLQDPLLTVSIPTLGELTSDSWFTAIDDTGANVGSDVSVTLSSLLNNNYTIQFSNSNAFDVQINRVQVWGEPAKIVDSIDYSAYDEDSVTKYGEIVLTGDTITNNFFGSESNCESFALTIIDAYKDFAGVIEISVKGDPSLQLGDIITLDTREHQGEYKVTSIANSLTSNTAPQIIKASKYNPRHWAFWDIAVWDGAVDVWAP